MGCATSSSSNDVGQSPTNEPLSEKVKSKTSGRSTADLSNQMLSVLPTTVGGELPRILLASNNMLSRWPKENKTWMSLEEIDCSLNRFTKVPEQLASLPKLTSLDLSGNPFTRVGSCDAVVNLARLSTIRIADCGLKTLPAPLFAAPSLTSVDVSSNSGIDLNGNGFARAKWKKLDISLCGLENLPRPLVAGPSTLTSLNISGNSKLSDPDFGALASSLTEIKCEQMGWAKLPSNLRKLRKLTSISLGRNGNLKDLTGLSSFPALTFLDLSDCSLTVLPNGIEEVPNLHNLIASGNPLENLTGISEKLLVLKRLDLCRVHRLGSGMSQYHEMWESICLLVNLEQLSWASTWTTPTLDGSQLVDHRFPLQLCQLQRLTTLNGLTIDRQMFLSTVANNCCSFFTTLSSTARPDIWVPRDALSALVSFAEVINSDAHDLVIGAVASKARYLAFLLFLTTHSYNVVSGFVPPRDVLIYHYLHMQHDDFAEHCIALFGKVIPNWMSTLLSHSGFNAPYEKTAPNDSRLQWQRFLSTYECCDDPVMHYDATTGNPLSVATAAKIQKELAAHFVASCEELIPDLSQLVEAFLPLAGEIVHFKLHFERASDASFDRYCKWLCLCIQHEASSTEGKGGLYATLGIQVIHAVHKMFPSKYRANVLALGSASSSCRVPVDLSADSFQATCRLWQDTFHEPFVDTGIKFANRHGTEGLVGVPSFVHQPARHDSLTKRSRVTIVD